MKPRAAPERVQTNPQGLYAFPALVPSTYTVKVNAKGFQAKEITGIALHAGDVRAIPAFSLAVGSEYDNGYCQRSFTR